MIFQAYQVVKKQRKISLHSEHYFEHLLKYVSWPELTKIEKKEIKIFISSVLRIDPGGREEKECWKEEKEKENGVEQWKQKEKAF